MIIDHLVAKRGAHGLVFASTRYEDQEGQQSIESQSETLSIWWDGLDSKGPGLVTHDGTEFSAVKILGPLVLRLDGPVDLEAVWDLAERGLTWGQTKLGKALQEQLDGEVKEWKEELEAQAQAEKTLNARMKDIKRSAQHKSWSEQLEETVKHTAEGRGRISRAHQFKQRGMRKLKVKKFVHVDEAGDVPPL
jgi:hypothetical protein